MKSLPIRCDIAVNEHLESDEDAEAPRYSLDIDERPDSAEAVLDERCGYSDERRGAVVVVADMMGFGLVSEAMLPAEACRLVANLVAHAPQHVLPVDLGKIGVDAALPVTEFHRLTRRGYQAKAIPPVVHLDDRAGGWLKVGVAEQDLKKNRLFPLHGSAAPVEDSPNAPVQRRGGELRTHSILMAQKKNLRRGKMPSTTPDEVARAERAEKSRRHYAKNAERIKKASREYYQRNRDTVNEKMKQRYRKLCSLAAIGAAVSAECEELELE